MPAPPAAVPGPSPSFGQGPSPSFGSPPSFGPGQPPFGASPPSYGAGALTPLPAAAKPAVSPTSIWVVAVVSAILAAVVTSGMFIAFQSDKTTVTESAATTPSTTRSIDPIGNPPPGGLDIQALLEKAQPSVVSIHVGEDSAGVYGAAGSGVIVDADGTVLTNAHVVQGETNMEVTLFDGTRHDAELVGSLPDNDVALIRIKEPNGLIAAELGSAETTKVGDRVVAIGNALNLGGPPSVTEGIVSAKDRSIPVPGSRLDHLIQTDAAINPGNSGGALLNAAGQVIGIPTAIISDAQNIGFAISIDEVKPLIEQLRSGKGTVTPDTAFLGVSTLDIGGVNDEVKRQYGVSRDTGAFVTEVTPNSAASDAGLQPGDVIISIDGTVINEPADVGTVVRTKKAGDQITIEYQRKGDTRSATTTLKTRKDSGN